jgi:hemolysin activation/secretion protein
MAQEHSGDIFKSLDREEKIPKEMPREAPVIKKGEEKKKEEKKEEKALPAAKILVRKFQIEGNTLLDEKVIQSLVSPSEGKELTLQEVQDVAARIGDHYRQLGYILANAFVPAQTVKNGIVLIRVVEGRVDRILVSGNKRYTASFIEKHLSRIRGDSSLREGDLERPLLILNDYPSLSVKALLKAGEHPGTTDIVVQVEEGWPVTGSLQYDNFGQKKTSKDRVGMTLGLSSLLFQGDQLMVRGVTGIDRIDIDRLTYGRADFVVPVGANGTKAGIYYTNSRYSTGEDATILEVDGKSNIWGLYATHPLLKRLGQSLELRVGFDWKDMSDYLLEELWSNDNIRVFTTGLHYDLSDRWGGRNLADVTVHMGVRDLLGGTGRNDDYVSRLNADGQFFKYTLDVVRYQRLPGYNYLILKGSGQISGDALFVAEQFSLGGIGSVRGFKTSAASGDSGYLTSVEILTSPVYPEKTILGQKVGDTFKFALFLDHGGVFRNALQAGESRSVYLTSVGAGIRIQAGKYASFRLDWAVPRIEGKFERDNAETYVQAAVSF